MLDMQFASNTVRDKHIRKLVSALKDAGLEVSVTKGKQHIRVENPQTHKVVFFGGNSLGDWRAAKNILRDLKLVGFDQDIKLGQEQHMAKITKTLTATLTKNTSVEKGGAWLLTIIEGVSGAISESPGVHSAWANPSAAKRFLRAYVQQNTPRKSIKMVVQATNALDKPTHLSGELSWKEVA